MGIYIRIDVDKPYGHHTLFRKVISKVSEDYLLTRIQAFGYLLPSKKLLAFLNSENAVANFYFRICTFPDKEVLALLRQGRHNAGLHLENSRNYETFKAELDHFVSLGLQPTDFTKHGSGQLKLGKYHYPPYEPEKYAEWAERSGTGFFSGNGIAASIADLTSSGENGKVFFPNLFWMEHAYRDKNLRSIDSIIEIAAKTDVCVIIHPANYVTFREVRNDFESLVRKANAENIPFKLFRADA